MNILQIISTAVSIISAVIMTVLAWIMLGKRTQTEVTFTGVPVDKKEFDKHVAEDTATHNQIFAKIGGAERGLEARLTSKIDSFQTESNESRRGLHRDIQQIGERLSKMEGVSEINGQTLVRVEAKFDRVLERESS